MSYQINVTPESESTFNQNLDYLEKEWSNKVMNQFLDDVDEVIRNIRKNPFLYPLCDYGNNVRMEIINKRIILYFTIVDEATIELLTFWNTWRNPENLKL